MPQTQNDLLSLGGKTAIVTGGAGGIGTANCQALARASASITTRTRPARLR